MPGNDDGGEGRNRTDECSFCRAVPYHLATPPSLWDTDNMEAIRCRKRNFVRGLGKLNRNVHGADDRIDKCFESGTLTNLFSISHKDFFDGLAVVEVQALAAGHFEFA